MAGRLSNREIITAWWPLAASWLLMSAELPMVSACVARMPEASLQLAAFGSIVFPLALVIEGPVIMMLAAATALAEHPENLRRLWRFMHQLGLLLTVIHAIFAFTPLLDVVVINMMGAPEELVEPTRLGVRLMLPWSWLIADRRFHQGVLIRHGYSRTVGIGTAVRLISTLSMLFVGYQLQWGSGVAVACSTLSGAVFAEAIYVRWAIWKFGAIEDIPEVDVPPMSFKDLVTFYWPLALSPLVALIALPIGSSGSAGCQSRCIVWLRGRL
jgi:hypothetical protein